MLTVMDIAAMSAADKVTRGQTPPPGRIARLSEISGNYDLLICDIWGIVHNGLKPHMAAGAALARYRQGGGTVVLVSNAPRPAAEVRRQMDRIGVSGDIADAIITSGDVTLGLIGEKGGAPFYYLGPEHDLATFGNLGVPIAGIDSAEYIVCTGLAHDETETPESYGGLLQRCLARKLQMICANPDLVVERGDKIFYCAGALADAYVKLGGEAVYAGKPHRPIYSRALSQARRHRAGTLERSRVLAIGDAIRTDVAGARAIGLDCLFVTAGIHAHEIHGATGEIDETRLAAFIGKAEHKPDFVARSLVW